MPTNAIMLIEVAVALIIGLDLVPKFFGLPFAHWSEWLATITAGSVGWLIARGTSRRERFEFAGDDVASKSAVARE
jgi:hypothetical protein